jgi:hypothetical protein
MHDANLNASLRVAFADEFDPDEPESDVLDDAFGDPPPHAAKLRPSATKTASSAAPRQYRRLAMGARPTF